jgi:hypothetical protein
MKSTKIRAIALAGLMTLSVLALASLAVTGHVGDPTEDESALVVDSVSTTAAIEQPIVSLQGTSSPHKDVTYPTKISEADAPMYDPMAILLMMMPVLMLARTFVKFAARNTESDRRSFRQIVTLRPFLSLTVDTQTGEREDETHDHPLRSVLQDLPAVQSKLTNSHIVDFRGNRIIATSAETQNKRLMTDGGQVEANADSMSLTDGGYNGMDDTDTNKLHVATQPTRRQQLLKIVSHPDYAPSMEELQFQSPDLTRSGIKDHLEKLQDVNVVKKVELEPGSDARKRDLPHIFWTITGEGARFLQKHEVIPTDPTPLQEIYAQTEKPDRIQQCEDVPRPDGVPTDIIGHSDGVGEVDDIIEEYNRTGDEDTVAKQILEIEDENDDGGTIQSANQTPKPESTGGILEELLRTVHILEERIKDIEKEIHSDKKG